MVRFTSRVSAIALASSTKICRRLVLASVLGISGAALVEPSPSSADTVEWLFTSQHPRKVHVRIHAQVRNHVWPPGGNVWSLNDSSPHTIRVECVSGEKICYGAWDPKNKKISWGKGHGGNKGCSDCCVHCADGKKAVVLPALTLHDDN